MGNVSYEVKDGSIHVQMQAAQSLALDLDPNDVRGVSFSVKEDQLSNVAFQIVKERTRGEAEPWNALVSHRTNLTYQDVAVITDPESGKMATGLKQDFHSTFQEAAQEFLQQVSEEDLTAAGCTKAGIEKAVQLKSLESKTQSAIRGLQNVFAGDFSNTTLGSMIGKGKRERDR